MRGLKKKKSTRFQVQRRVSSPPLRAVYRVLYRTWGPQHWWPGRTRFEIIVGAVLTQNTAWSNVEKAIARLRKAGALSLEHLHRAPLDRVAAWIRPAGYFRVKARRLRALTAMIVERYGGLRKMLRQDTARLREALLSVSGVGPETADSILLYAAGRPVFVVDAYTRRFMARHGWLAPEAPYEETARTIVRVLPRDARLYNEFHALIVRLGKQCCRPAPRCHTCPLAAWLPPGGPYL